MKETKLVCKKYQMMELGEEELEEHQCFCKFRHNGICAICPNVVNAKTQKQLYKEIFSKQEVEESREDVLEHTALAIARILKASREIEKKGGIFNV